MASEEKDVCFVEDWLHKIAISKYSDLAERFIRLNNYDHIDGKLFEKLKVVLNNPDLSRFKKPIPKMCLSCCNYLRGMELPSTPNKRKYSSVTPEPINSSTDTAFHKLINEIKTQNFTEHQMNILMNAVGERLAPIINEHVSGVNKRSLGNRFEEIVTMTYASYWAKSLSPIRHFFLGMINNVG